MAPLILTDEVVDKVRNRPIPAATLPTTNQLRNERRLTVPRRSVNKAISGFSSRRKRFKLVQFLLPANEHLQVKIQEWSDLLAVVNTRRVQLFQRYLIWCQSGR